MSDDVATAPSARTHPLAAWCLGLGVASILPGIGGFLAGAAAVTVGFFANEKALDPRGRRWVFWGRLLGAVAMVVQAFLTIFVFMTFFA